MGLYIKEKYNKLKKKMDFLYVESTFCLLLALILLISVKNSISNRIKKRKGNEL